MADKTVYVSGCLGTDLESGKLVPGGAKAEAEAALNHLKNILRASGSSLTNVVKCTVYLQNFDDFPIVNDIYREGKFDLHEMRSSHYSEFNQMNLLIFSNDSVCSEFPGQNVHSGGQITVECSCRN